MSGSPGSAIALHDVTLAYDGHPAIHHLSAAFDRGSLTAIVGPNGSGKSTLIKGMVGLLRPATGLIQPAGLGGGGIAYLPQHADIERRFPISVIQTVLLGHWRRIGWARSVTRELREGAQRALAAVGLAGFERRPMETLSAGQFQRVLFARLIAQDAEVILLDEPLAAVDWRTSEDLLRLIVSWHREGRTVAAVLHDLDQVRAYFPDTLLLARELVAWGPTREVLMPQNLRRARQMSEAWSGEGEDHRPIPGPRRAGLARYPDPLPASGERKGPA
ncbi:MAG: ABC transporter ATP-binding protein [Alphaproteobacteria bacterium]|nr:ABC transporter ATP-binding protein [Alphaproteobacteria bacterium]